MPRTSRTLTHAGRTLTLRQWAAESGIPESTIRARVERLHWPVARALATPADKRFARSPGRPANDAPRSPPKLKRHRGGQACCRWMEEGKRHQRYFGQWKSAKAREGYARFLRDWSARVAEGSPVAGANETGTVAGLLGAWLDHAKARYQKFGRQTSEYHVCRAVARLLAVRLARLPVDCFGIRELEAVRADMIAKGWTRGTVNKYTARAVSCFAWGVPRKLVARDTHYSLLQIEHLAPGATIAPDPEPIRSAEPAHVAAVLAGAHLHSDPQRRAVLAAMIRVQLLTGCRPNELCAMHPAHIDRAGREWKYTVPGAANKNHHRGKPRVVWIGPRAQESVLPLVLAAELAGHQVFVFPRVRHTDTGPRPVTRSEYARLIRAACEGANVPRWHPHQLRHNRATDLKRIYESDAAAARGIGASEDVTVRIYADPQEIVDRRIARETG